MRLAVTGASGFCGGYVALAAAATGTDVVCVGRRPGPVGAQRFWDAAGEPPDFSGVDAVVHVAAAVGDPGNGPAAQAAYRAVNVDGTARLLDAAGDRTVVYVSSASVYDPRTDRRHVTEEHPVGGHLNAYGRTKADGDRIALDAGAVVLRPRGVYGSGDPHLVPRLRRRVRRGRLGLPGPDVRLSLTAVENLADACLAALDWPAGAYNIVDAQPYPRDATLVAVLAGFGTSARVVHVPLRLAELAARLAEAAARSRPPALSRYAVDQLAHDVVLDIGKATAQGWRPRRSVADYVADLHFAQPDGTGQR
ncbi:MAG: epimerase [Actinobacteria bacterium 13_2_20CM_2_71_6]|nr:MAG: epimerase [Actinobacteria bacterium 13_2_20CM_2_71_6]